MTFNLDSFAKGDQFLLQGSYADGAIEYTGVSGHNQSNGNAGLGIIRGTQGAIVDLADAFVDPVTGSLSTVEAWTIRADFRHFWTPTLRSTLFGGYTSVSVPTSRASPLAPRHVRRWTADRRFATSTCGRLASTPPGRR